jgi:hypothetical protein
MVKTVGYSILALVLATCTTHHKSVIQRDPTKPPCIVYKTRSNYDSLVHIRLTEDKKNVVVYPAPIDITHNGVLPYPTKLAQDYLLDNRGISIHSAFINIKLADYSRLQQAPSESEFLARIVDDNPFTEIYYCGNRTHDSLIIHTLNAMINQNRMNEWERIK